ncbi:hypothetical protein [Conexibacter sp. DBS9H8]|uniref:hypothetical protein n=1 Tax=Conexibacter sp. DBS9H8 TaxID=2937801 RepID=UPI00200DC405|nr:hypothetical protein [Conexibacter sp. DBS9H8]
MSEPPPAEPGSHRHIVETLLADAAAAHATLLAGLPEDLARVLPVDAQGIQAAIDHLARAADLDAEEQRALIRPHAVNPAVLHARVFGAQRLTDATVHAAFSEGVRVRALALGALADRIGGGGARRLGPAAAQRASPAVR